MIHTCLTIQSFGNNLLFFNVFALNIVNIQKTVFKYLKFNIIQKGRKYSAIYKLAINKIKFSLNLTFLSFCNKK